MALLRMKKANIACPCLYLETEKGNFAKIEVLNYIYPENDDYWEGNWLRVNVTAEAGAFNATYEGKLKTYNLKDFKRGLEREMQYHDQKGVSAYLQSLENWIEMKIVGDGKGKFDVQCIACDAPPYGNKMIFKLKIDRDDIHDMIEQVDEILEKFPIRGKE